MRILERCLLAMLASIVAILFGLSALVGLSALTEHEAVVIRGGSMEPAVGRGSLAVLTPVAGSDVRVGSIVTVRADNGILVTHRVAEVVPLVPAHFRLRGDANESPDSGLVSSEALIGRVDLVIPMAGYLAWLARHPAGLTMLVSLVCTLYLALHLVRSLDGQAGQQTWPGVTRPVVAGMLILALIPGSVASDQSTALFGDAETTEALIETAASW